MDAVTEHLLIGGELSEAMLCARLTKLKCSSKKIRYLVVKLDFMENLLDRAYLVNNLLFHLCFFKCFFLGSEPVFLSESVQVKVEVQNYLNGFLFQKLEFLRLLPKKHLRFDLNLFEFPLDNVEHPVQACCFFIDQVIEKKNTTHFSIFPPQSLLNKFRQILRDGAQAAPLKRTRVLDLLENHFVNNPNLKGQLTFASLTLFCQMAALEFGNLNHNCLLDYKDFDGPNAGIDMAVKKPALFNTVLQICVRSTNQSVQAISTQESAFRKLNVNSLDQK